MTGLSGILEVRDNSSYKFMILSSNILQIARLFAGLEEAYSHIGDTDGKIGPLIIFLLRDVIR